MTSLPDAMMAFRCGLEAHLQIDPTACVIDCEAHVAEDASCVILVAELYGGGLISAGFDLVPGDPFEAGDCELVQFGLFLMAGFACAFCAPGGEPPQS